jgi:two-component system LytT family response regulator
VQLRLQDVERVLNAEQFIRIHRSHIINLAFAVAFEPYDAWRLEVVLKNGQRIVASRAGTQRLRELPLRSK